MGAGASPSRRVSGTNLDQAGAEGSSRFTSLWKTFLEAGLVIVGVGSNEVDDFAMAVCGLAVVASDLDCPHNGERAHGGRPVHAFARPDRYSGASEPDHAPHGLPRRRPRSEALPKRAEAGRGHLTPIAPGHLEPARIRPRHPPRRNVSACTNALPAASRAVTTDLRRSASPPVFVLANDVARA